MGWVSFQVDHQLPLAERLEQVERVVDLLGIDAEWSEFVNRPGQWSYQARYAVIDGIRVEVWAHVHADELLPASRELVEAAG
jgi:hypothetical protein